MKKIRKFIVKVYRRLNALLVIGGFATSFGLYKAWPHLGTIPAPHFNGEGLVYVGLALLYCGMMKSSINGYQSAE